MMLCSEIIKELDRLAPPELACDWDNSGFQAGRAQKEVHKVLVALDATDEVVRQAVDGRADMLVTHHPLIFKPLKRVNDQDFISRRILDMLQNDICYFAMHTNFDIAPGCMADLAAGRLGMVAEGPLEVTGRVEDIAVGIGKVGSLPGEMTVPEVARLVKERFGLPFVTVFGMEQAEGPVRRVAISPGAGNSMVQEAIAKGVQVLITGDIGHHNGIDAAANGMAVVDAGHYGIEQIFIPFVCQYLLGLPGAEVAVVGAKPAFPARVVV